ncbi:hypothetical protein V8C26DRAFT_392643 [Trichoderma gracile]
MEEPPTTTTTRTRRTGPKAQAIFFFFFSIFFWPGPPTPAKKKSKKSSSSRACCLFFPSFFPSPRTLLVRGALSRLPKWGPLNVSCVARTTYCCCSRWGRACLKEKKEPHLAFFFLACLLVLRLATLHGAVEGREGWCPPPQASEAPGPLQNWQEAGVMGWWLVAGMLLACWVRVCTSSSTILAAGVAGKEGTCTGTSMHVVVPTHIAES